MQPVDWALTRGGLTAPKKLLLVTLAWVADNDGVTIKGQKALAERVAQDERWVREHLKGLAEAGLVSRLRRHRMNGSRTSDLIVLNMPRDRPLDLDGYSGIVGELEPGDRPPTGGNPPVGPTGGNLSTYRRDSAAPELTSEPTSVGKSSARDKREDAPEGFPDELRPHARAVMTILRQVAEDHGAKKVWPRAVGLVLMAHPHHPLVQTAQDLQAWAVDPGRKVVDVVATYRTFLRRAPVLEGTERLGGAPARGRAQRPRDDGGLAEWIAANKKSDEPGVIDAVVVEESEAARDEG